MNVPSWENQGSTPSLYLLTFNKENPIYLVSLHRTERIIEQSVKAFSEIYSAIKTFFKNIHVRNHCTVRH